MKPELGAIGTSTFLLDHEPPLSFRRLPALGLRYNF